jgi:hypothetical protein
MNFTDGDRIIGQYGNTWERINGQWYMQNIAGRGDSSSDSTMEWLINLKVETLANRVKKTRKLSKSDPIPPESFIYRYTYHPKGE